jgi:hypothetical protein
MVNNSVLLILVELLTTTDCFVDIGGIDDHHCLEVIVCFVDIGGIVDHKTNSHL